jgi:hypothetical protein
MDQNILLYLLIFGAVLFAYFYFVYIFNSNNNKNKSNYEIPKTIWSYWNTEQKPKLIEDIQKYNTKNINGKYKIIFLTDQTLNQYIPTIPSYLTTIEHIQAKSDWIRLYLLKTYGGIWLDASIIINNVNAIDNLYNESIANMCQFTGFTLDKNGSSKRGIPLFIENYFIIAPKQSTLITAWFNEFEYAIKKGFLKYKKEDILDQGIDVRSIYNYETDVYMTMHACMQKLVQKKLETIPKMILKRAEETLFKLHEDCKWNSICVMNNLKDNTNVKNIPFIKLHRFDRGVAVDISKFFE